MRRAGVAIGGVIGGIERSDEGGGGCKEEAEEQRCAGAGLRDAKTLDVVESGDTGGGAGGAGRTI